MMSSRPNPSLLRRQFGAELRRLRLPTGQTVAEVARRLGWSESKLSRIETATIGVSNRDLERLLMLYDVALDDRSKLITLAGQARQRGWWEAYGNFLPNTYESFIGGVKRS